MSVRQKYILELKCISEHIVQFWIKKRSDAMNAHGNFISLVNYLAEIDKNLHLFGHMCII